jgi:flagellar basal body rod protein FlgG
MTPEQQPLDLSAFAKKTLLEIKYSFDESDEYKPTMNLIPLAAAVDFGLAKVVKTKDDNFYVVTPAVIKTRQESEASVDVVSAEWSGHLQEKEITTYTYTNCVACGAPLVDNNTEETTQEKIHCSHCNTQNQGTSPQTKKIQVQEFDVESVFEEEGWIGTIEELAKETEVYQANQSNRLKRLKNVLRSKPAPIEAIRAGKDLVTAEQKIIITGSISDSDRKDIFVQIGKLQTIGEKREETHEAVSRGKRYPRIPGAYLLDESTDITDRGDYLLIIEADSGDKLPLVVMNDRDGNPSRFAVSVGDLMKYGWKITTGVFTTQLNTVIETSNLQKTGGPKSVTVGDYGTVKVFEWNSESDRHEAIMDELDDYNFEYSDPWVSADIPLGNVSALYIEQT